MPVLSFIAWKSTDPTIVAAFAGHVSDAAAWHRELEQFMVDINIAYPVDGGVRVPLMDGNVLVAVSNPADPFSPMSGWNASLMLGGHVPDEGSPQGLHWAKRMDALPAHPGDLTDEHLRIAVHGDLGTSHVHADVWLHNGDEPAVYVLWPVGEQIAPLVEEMIGELGGGDMWVRATRQDALASFEALETQAA